MVSPAARFIVIALSNLRLTSEESRRHWQIRAVSCKKQCQLPDRMFGSVYFGIVYQTFIPASTTFPNGSGASRLRNKSKHVHFMFVLRLHCLGPIDISLATAIQHTSWRWCIHSQWDSNAVWWGGERTHQQSCLLSAFFGVSGSRSDRRRAQCPPSPLPPGMTRMAGAKLATATLAFRRSAVFRMQAPSH